ncbi:MAG: TonB-dependent receptor, partial [Saprospiraceae bacterium]|nr:TonB-dependent receptor [Pyrinomonadaceae bacterium]
WVKGNHTFSFGGQYKRIETKSNAVDRIVPTVTFGILTADTVANNVFSASSGNFPGASATDIANAAGVYATLTGRISGYTNAAVLSSDGAYVPAGARYFEIRETTAGLFGQDTWRIRPNLTLSFGLRWQPQTGAQTMTPNFARLTNPDMIYDISGPGNQFNPGTLTGAAPTVTGVQVGEKVFRDDFNNFAPSVGVVYSPEFKSGILKTMFGESGTSVFRGGFSRAFIREGTFIVETLIGRNPGSSLSLNRATTTSNLTPGTLFSTPGNPNLTNPAFTATPAYPRAITAVDNQYGFSSDFRSGYVDSWSVGYQRQLGRDTVVEIRYVGNRGKDMLNVYNLNETNAIENGFGAEFALAQQNLLANIAAGRGSNFRYFGAATGTSPLPILMSYLGNNNLDPNLTTSYASANFANATFIGQLSSANPNVLGFASTVENNFRATGTANGTFRAGRPRNFFNNCPTTVGFCFLGDNSEKSWYDSVTIELRRRLSDGLRVQASYTFGKAFTNAFASAGTSFFGLGAGDQGNASNNTLRNRDLDKSFSQVDLRKAFKFDATYDLPFGKGRSFFSSSNGFVDAVVGGWSISPVVRWQSGSPSLLENIQLVGMTAEELQEAVKVRKEANFVYYLPQDIVDNTIRAFNTVGTTTSGYSAGNAPAGRFIAPAGFGNCQARAPGECGYRKLVLYGPSFFKFDASVLKRIAISERRNVEFRATFFDVLNETNWRVGGWTGNVINITGLNLTNFGQLGTGTSYQDPNGSNDPGGRLVDLMLRINF